MENDPKKFWSLINKLSNTSSGVVSDNGATQGVRATF